MHPNGNHRVRGRRRANPEAPWWLAGPSWAYPSRRQGKGTQGGQNMRRLAVAAGLVGLVTLSFGGGVAHAAGPQPEPPTSCAVTGTATFKRPLSPNPNPNPKFRDHSNAMVLNATLTDCTQGPRPTPYTPIDHGVLTLKAKAPTTIAEDFFTQATAKFKVTWYTATGKRIGTTKSPRPHPMQPRPGPMSGTVTLDGNGTADAKSKVFGGEPFTMTLVTDTPQPWPQSRQPEPMNVGKFGGDESRFDIGA
jgi:hypothetical protein